MVQSLAVSNDRFYATGKRKSSIARVWLKVGSGTILVNGKKYNEYLLKLTVKFLKYETSISLSDKFLVAFTLKSISKGFRIFSRFNSKLVSCAILGLIIDTYVVYLGT